MPRLSTKEEPKKTLIQQVQENVRKLQAEEDIEEIKKIVCVFYKNGSNPLCRGCAQPEDLVLDCKGEYLKRIESKPMEEWNESFDKLKQREKQNISTIVDVEVGQNCNRCYISDRCPKYEIDAMCAIDFGEDLKGKKVTEIYDEIINLQYKRLRRVGLIEDVEGGMIDANLSAEIDRLDRLLAARSNAGTEKLEINIKGSRPAEAAGELPKAEGILSRMFGPKPKEIEAPISIPVTATHVTTKTSQNMESS